MARGEFGAANYLNASVVPVSAAPLTIAFWMYPLSAINQVPFSLARPSNNDCFMCYMTSSNGLRFYVRQTDSVAQAVGPNYTTNAWQHVALVTGSSSSRYCYRSGTPGSEETTTKAPVLITQTTIGAWKHAVVAYPFDGYVAEVGIWDVALTTDEVAALAGGLEPAMIRRASLQATWRCTPGAAGEADPINSYDLTETGTVAHQTHPPIRRAKIATPGCFGFGRRFAV